MWNLILRESLCSFLIAALLCEILNLALVEMGCCEGSDRTTLSFLDSLQHQQRRRQLGPFYQNPSCPDAHLFVPSQESPFIPTSYIVSPRTKSFNSRLQNSAKERFQTLKGRKTLQPVLTNRI